jgi:ribosomal protein S18 acetylase RimI-like enzyme
MVIALKITKGITPDEDKQIFERLRDYNLEAFGQSNRRDLCIPLRDEHDAITGGLVGYTGRGWLYVSMLYIPGELRGQGLATRMLQMAEDEARNRQCTGAYIDTMNPAALGLYLKLGYEIIGKLDDLDGGHSVHWLQKRFR